MANGRGSGSTGQTLALFALALPAVLGLMGLGLDSAQVLLERRHAQSASDLAALAGARNLPDSQSAATSDALAVALDNGYPAGDVTITFPSAAEISVDIAVDLDMHFLSVIGISDMDVSAGAVAVHVPAYFPNGDGLPAVLGGWRACGQEGSSDKVVQMSGANIHVDGNVKSNGGGFWNGDNGTSTGDISFVQVTPKPPKTASCQDNIFSTSGNPPVNPVSDNTYMDYPLPYGAYDAATLCAPEPGKVVWDLGTSSINISKPSEGYLIPGTDQLKDGVYCLGGVGNTLTVGNSDTFGNVTLVAETVKVSQARINLTHYWNGLTIFAWGTGSNTLQWSGADAVWLGLLFAPDGPVHVNGAEAFSTLGAIWGHEVQFNGSDLTLTTTGLIPFISISEELALVG